MAFRKYTDSGELAGANYPHFLYIYPNTYREDLDHMTEACSAADKMCSQLQSYGALDYYAVYQYDKTESDHDYPYCDESDFLGEFRAWYTGKYDDRQGTHICFDEDTSGGKAEGGNTVSGSAFNTSRAAVAGFSEISGGRATICHEALHTMIIEDTVVGYESDDLAENNEHELGRVYYSDEVSPLANNHSGNASPEGDCSSDRLEQDEVIKPTYCSKEGVYRTTREVY